MLAVFVVIYIAVFGTGVSYMVKLMLKGPQEDVEAEPARKPGQTHRPARPLSAAPDDVDPAIV
jgi:cytochrome d ubiquinol oxidase subunit I